MEERLRFYSEGDIPRKNKEVMSEALKDHETLVDKIVRENKKRDREEMANGNTACVFIVGIMATLFFEMR